MSRDRENDEAKRKARREREAKERALLRKELDDFVKKHVAAGTAAGRGYEREVKKRQDAIDEHYAGTLNGLEVAREKARKEKAAAKSVELEKKVEALREAPGRLSREKKRELEGLEEELEGLRKKAKGGRACGRGERRAEATSAVAKLRRDLQQARRGAGAAQARRVEDLGKELKKAERQLAKLEAKDRRTELADGLQSKLLVLEARTTAGTALARDVETLGQALFCVEIKFRAPHAIDATCFRSCVCSTAWRLTKVHAIFLRPNSLVDFHTGALKISAPSALRHE